MKRTTIEWPVYGLLLNEGRHISFIFDQIPPINFSFCLVVNDKILPLPHGLDKGDYNTVISDTSTRSASFHEIQYSYAICIVRDTAGKNEQWPRTAADLHLPKYVQTLTKHILRIDRRRERRMGDLIQI